MVKRLAPQEPGPGLSRTLSGHVGNRIQSQRKPDAGGRQIGRLSMEDQGSHANMLHTCGSTEYSAVVVWTDQGQRMHAGVRASGVIAPYGVACPLSHPPDRYRYPSRQRVQWLRFTTGIGSISGPRSSPDSAASYLGRDPISPEVRSA